MRRYRTIALTTALAAAALIGAAPASAGGLSFSLGAAFEVGHVAFHVAYTQHGHGYAPYYYRTAVPLRYSGHHCSEYCVRQSSYVYHVPSCPLLGLHFARYGYAAPYHGGHHYYESHHPRYRSYHRGHHGHYKKYRSYHHRPRHHGSHHYRSYGHRHSHHGEYHHRGKGRGHHGSKHGYHSRRDHSGKHSVGSRHHGRKHDGARSGSARRSRPRGH